MCLTIYNLKSREEAKRLSKNPLIAEKDITVYKILNKDNISPYQYFKYEKGYEYYNDKNKPFSFRIQRHDWGRRGFVLEIHKGLHSYKTRQNVEYYQKYNEKIVKMVIPKGAKYFTDGKEIVSDRLIWY